MKNLISFSNFANVCLRFLMWRHRAVQNRNFLFLLLLSLFGVLKASRVPWPKLRTKILYRLLLLLRIRPGLPGLPLGLPGWPAVKYEKSGSQKATQQQSKRLLLLRNQKARQSCGISTKTSSRRGLKADVACGMIDFNHRGRHYLLKCFLLSLCLHHFGLVPIGL